MTVITVLGLGEAGALYARGLRDAGYEVSGFDPFVELNEPGVTQTEILADALANADLALSLVGARAAADVAEAALPEMKQGAIYADLNTASPVLKAKLEEAAINRGVLFADVAVLAPVPRNGSRTPLMVSGGGSECFSELFSQTGAPVEAIGGEAGDAAARKLLRSVFMKGLATVIIECMGAARQAGAEDWLHEQIVAELSGSSDALVKHLLEGSRIHAERRSHEVSDAIAYLAELGEPSWMTAAARQWFDALVNEKSSAQVTEGVNA